MVSVNVPPPCNKVDPDALNIAVVTFGTETRAGRRALRVIQQLGMKDCSLIDFRLVLQPTEEEEKACLRKDGKRSAVKRAVIGHRQFLSSMHKALSDTTKHKDKPARVFFRVCRDGGTKSYVVGATEVAALNNMFMTLPGGEQVRQVINAKHFPLHRTSRSDVQSVLEEAWAFACKAEASTIVKRSPIDEESRYAYTACCGPHKTDESEKNWKAVQDIASRFTVLSCSIASPIEGSDCQRYINVEFDQPCLP